MLLEGGLLAGAKSEEWAEVGMLDGDDIGSRTAGSSAVAGGAAMYPSFSSRSTSSDLFCFLRAGCSASVDRFAVGFPFGIFTGGGGFGFAALGFGLTFSFGTTGG